MPEAATRIGPGSAPSGGEPSSSLDALETNQQILAPEFNSTQCRLLGKAEPLQERVIIALELTELPNAGKRASKINGCAAHPLIGVRQDGAPALCLCRCRDRLCQICTRYRSLQVAARMSAIVSRMRCCKFLTLTLADDGSSLTQRLDRLIESFRELRRRAEWRRNVDGGVAVIEITRGKDGFHWHVHLHALIDADFIPQRSLSDMWHQITGDSMIVDIRAVHDRHKAARYVTKYAAKSGNLWGWTFDEIAEYAEALHRRRMVITFGSCHNVPIDNDEDVPGIDDERALVGVGQVKRAAAKGCGAAARLIDLAGRHGGLIARVFGHPYARGEFEQPEPWDASLSASWRAAYDEFMAWMEPPDETEHRSRTATTDPQLRLIAPPDEDRCGLGPLR